jgi:thiosulfate dehydrogenase
MKNTSIRWTRGGTVCLLLTGFLVGCSEQCTSPKSVAPGSAKSPAMAASANVTVEPAVAADAAVAKLPEAAPAKTTSKGDVETVKVSACDGGGAVEVAKGATGQALADSLMDQWKRNHPEAKWVADEKERHTLQAPADNSNLLKAGQAKGDTYGNFTERDLLTWARETEKFAAEGSRIFHSADLLGSTVAVSCDMCHPHAANTHPETYPKFQMQLGRVVLLRDMINWCVENPVRATKLDPDGPKMRALEAYIMAQRKGVPMNYGKH